VSPAPSIGSLADRLDAALPQTQCTRCGYPDCRHYAEAMASGEADINQCPPGGAEGIRRLSALTGRPVVPLNPAHGVEGPVRKALIDEAWCIGCTLCIKACPVDCILGAPKAMHTVVTEACTGCELCIPACPVDCIAMVAGDGPHHALSGWAAWSEDEAGAARSAYTARQARLARDEGEQDRRHQAEAEHKLAHLEALTQPTDEAGLARRRAVVEAALERARQARADAAALRR
jgi:Na+-translocating ferredoxin:NAD+ oxidoreductase subunit B